MDNEKGLKQEATQKKQEIKQMKNKTRHYTKKWKNWSTGNGPYHRRNYLGAKFAACIMKEFPVTVNQLDKSLEHPLNHSTCNQLWKWKLSKGGES